MYVVTVNFMIKDEHIEAFREAMLENAERSLADEPGCRQFDVCHDPDEPGHVFLYELYEDAAAFQDHLASAHFESFDARVRDWVQAKDVDTWERIER